MKQLLLIALIILSKGLSAQTNEGIFAKLKFNSAGCFLKEGCKLEPEEPLTNVNSIEIFGYDKCSDSFAFVFQHKLLYIQSKYIENSKSIIDSIETFSKEERENLIKNGVEIRNTRLASIKQKISTLKTKYQNLGIAIVDYGVYDESEYTDGTSLKVTFFNPTSQKIKYIWLTVTGYNAVDDPVQLDFGNTYSKTVRCIGPIEPSETGSYEFEYFWMTDVVDYSKIKALKVQYMNGKIKNIPIPNQAFISVEDYSLILD